VTVIAVAVLFSKIAHGATAEPLARRYGPLLAPAASRDDPPGQPELPPTSAHPPGTGPGAAR
jgi:hypothetical protein